MFFDNLEKYQGRAVHKVDLLDKNKKETGHIKFKTELIWKEYTPPPSHELLDKKSLFKIIVHQANFLKDTGDLIGKQDPFIRFKYEGNIMETDVKNDAGKFAKWDETFQFPNIALQVRNEEQLIFEAYDSDVVSSELLCKCWPLDYVDLVSNTDLNKMDLDLFDSKGNKAGNIIIST